MWIELDGEYSTVTINGVIISLETLERITLPDSARLLRLSRRGNEVIVESYSPEHLMNNPALLASMIP
jgi:hypothetical protein